MECSEPGAIRDEELVAYLAGETVRPSVVQHLTHCQRCSSQLAKYRYVELELMSKLYRWDCPPSQILGEYQMGLLPQEQATAVKSHLRICMQCMAEVATLTAFLANDPMLVMPVSVTQKAAPVSSASIHNHDPLRETKRTLDQLHEQALAGVRRITAILLPQQPRLAYQRNASSQPTLWPRRYAAEDVSISIQVERDANRKDTLQLIGFVTRKGMAIEALQGTTVQLSTAGATGKTIYTQAIDELGNFVFSLLAPAIYTLELQLPESIIVLDQMAIAVQE